MHFMYISTGEAVNRLNNSVLEDKDILYMDFGANKTSVKVIEEDAFEGTYFRDIYSNVNRKWYKKLWTEFDQLKNIDRKYCYSNYCDIIVNKYGVKYETSLRFWENKGWIDKKDQWYFTFQWYFRYQLGRKSEYDKRQINRWKNVVSRFRGKLVKMIKDASSKFDDYSVLPKIREILLHWGYELTEKDFFVSLTN